VRDRFCEAVSDAGCVIDGAPHSGGRRPKASEEEAALTKNVSHCCIVEASTFAGSSSISDPAELSPARFALRADADLSRFSIDPSCFPQTVEGFGHYQCFTTGQTLNLRGRLPLVADKVRQFYVEGSAASFLGHVNV